MGKFIFRQGTSDDLELIKLLWEELNRIHFEASKQFKDRYNLMTWVKRKESLLAKSKEIHLEYVVDIETEKIVGYCISSVERDETTGEIDSIYVDQSFRKAGIGKNLFERSLQWLEAKQVQRQILSVSVDNEEVLEFYKQFEFYPLHLILQRK